MGKSCVPRNATNWHHYTRFRHNPELLAWLRRISVRPDPRRMYGTLGDGMWLSRAAVEAYIALGKHPRCYGELYVPTVLHHLGYEVIDVDSHSRLYDAVRWHPPYDRVELDRLRCAGATFAHPVKDADVRRWALATTVCRP